MSDKKTIPSILYVDYYQDSRDLMPYLLAAGGRNYDVSAFSSVGEALSAMSSHSFDVVILEYFMPEMRGEQACRLVRQINPHIPIIVYGALPERVVSVSTLAAGADVYLEKPRDLEAIPEAVEILLGNDEERTNVPGEFRRAG
jgi:CheY-like chemotaxis protein